MCQLMAPSTEDSTFLCLFSSLKRLPFNCTRNTKGFRTKVVQIKLPGFFTIKTTQFTVQGFVHPYYYMELSSPKFSCLWVNRCLQSVTIFTQQFKFLFAQSLQKIAPTKKLGKLPSFLGRIQMVKTELPLYCGFKATTLAHKVFAITKETFQMDFCLSSRSFVVRCLFPPSNVIIAQFAPMFCIPGPVFLFASGSPGISALPTFQPFLFNYIATGLANIHTRKVIL